MSRTIQEATIQPIHRDNPEPPQQSPRVVEQEQTIKVAPLAKKDNQKTGLKELSSSSLNSKTATTVKKNTLMTNKNQKSTSITTPSSKITACPNSMDKKRKSLDGVDDENSPMSENNTNISNKKRGSQSLPLRRRVGLSDGSNRRTLF